MSLAKEINKRAEKQVKCFVQVKTSNEESKHGISPEETIDFVKELAQFPKIQVVGLMTMAPYTDDEAVLRHCFRTLRNLQKQIQDLELEHAPCTELSMGMSNDFAIATEEGATFVRIGSALVVNKSGKFIYDGGVEPMSLKTRIKTFFFLDDEDGYEETYDERHESEKARHP